MKISFAEGQFVSIPFADETQRSVMPLVHIQGGHFRPIGTCFGITNDGLAVTARHVLDEAYGPALNSAGVRSEQAGTLAALYVSSDVDPETGHFTGGLLPVDMVALNVGLDIALIKIILPVDTRNGARLKFPAHELTLRVPAVGETIYGFGYCKMGWQHLDGLLSVDHRFMATRGVVEELYLHGRDSVMLPFPCFRTDARFDGGMSGGPILVYNPTGSLSVAGVICSSLEQGQTWISHASLVALALALSIDGANKQGEICSMHLWEFVKGGAVRADLAGAEILMDASGLTIIYPHGLRYLVSA